MRLRIGITVVIDLETGEAQSKATWQVEGQDGGLGPPLAQAAAALARLTTAAPAVTPLGTVILESSHSQDVEETARPHPAAKEARMLGGLLEIRDDVEKALQTRPAGRVLEVLKWMKARRGTSNFRSLPSLFWSLVVKD